MTDYSQGLEVRAVSVGHAGATVLHGIELDVRPGESVGLVGPNGVGKSTLLWAIAGLLTPSQGTIRFGGTDLAGYPPERRRRVGIALLAEGRRIFPSLTVHETLTLAHRSMGLSRAQTRDAVAQCYERFPSLARRHAVSAALMSGGEQQMLCMAVALASSPGLLLVDEPFMGLAPAITASLIDHFGNLVRAGVAMVMADESRTTLQRVGLDRIIDITKFGSGTRQGND